MNPLKHVAIIMDGNGRWGLKYKNSRKYSAEKSAQYRSRRLAKKAREERRQVEKESIDALNHQISYLTAVSGSDIVKSIQLNNIDNKEE